MMNENDSDAKNSGNGGSGSASFVLNRSRLLSWALFTLFSALALTAHETDDSNLGSGHSVWILVCSAVSLGLGALAVMVHIAVPSIFVGTWIEGLSSLALVGMWAGCLPTVMNPLFLLGQMYVGKKFKDEDGDYQARDYQSTISNANLFFTSWGASVTILTIFASFVRARSRGGLAVQGHTAKWYLMIVASVVVMIESLRFKKQICDEGLTLDITCKRNNYGFITSIISLVISTLISIMASIGQESTIISAVSSLLMLGLYSACAGLLTYGSGPATYVGNHFFSAWAGFFLSIAIFGGVAKDYMGMNARPAESRSDTASGFEPTEGEGTNMELNQM